MVSIQKDEDWQIFFTCFPAFSHSDAKILREKVFKRNLVHYPWTKDEDNFFFQIIRFFLIINCNDFITKN